MPASANIQLFLGQLLRSNGDRLGARKAFEAAKAVNPSLVAADLALAEVNTADGKTDDARKRLLTLVSANPGNKVGHLLLAQLELNSGQNSAAIDRYRKVVAIDDKNVLALNSLAYLLVEGNHPDEALKYARGGEPTRSRQPRRETRYFGMDLFPEGHVLNGGDASRGRYSQRGHGHSEI